MRGVLVGPLRSYLLLGLGSWLITSERGAWLVVGWVLIGAVALILSSLHSANYVLVKALASAVLKAKDRGVDFADVL